MKTINQKNKFIIPTLICLLLFHFDIPETHAKTISGRIVAIADGDTVTLLDTSAAQDPSVWHRCVEKRQPFGNRSRQHLAKLVFGREVSADCPKLDRYGRAICKLEVDGIDANLAQVEGGDGLALQVIRARSADRRPLMGQMV